MSLRQAPRFHAFFQHVEGRQVLLMPREDWNRLNEIRIGDMVEIGLTTTPIADVGRDCRIEAVVGLRRADAEVVVEVYRHDPKDAPKPINLDRYRVWECLPSHRDYVSMVNSASTEDNPNMRGFLEDHVFLVKEDVGRDEHHLAELTAQVRALPTRRTGGAA